jgi:CO/xanthine dehydrogenase Mo-binding subunit
MPPRPNMPPIACGSTGIRCTAPPCDRDRCGASRLAQKRPQSGVGLGFACAIYHRTYVAQIAEVSVTGDDEIILQNVWFQQAASWTLFEQLEVDQSEMKTQTWREYRIARFHDAPQEICVTLCGQADVPSTGAGEPGSVPVAAALSVSA